ncbi:MAG TPA: periplasmic heavy metal sensor [Byssovorax sp.]|jgi:hypothetical protein
MCGILIGTACLIGLIFMLKRRRRCGGGRGGSCGGRSGRWGRHGGWGGGDHDHGGGWGPGFFLRAVLERLDATPDQEKVIRSAVDEVREAARGAKDELKKSRSDVAKAVRGPSVDEVFFGDLFARHDTAIESVRKAAMGALAKIHDVLDEKQRQRLGDLIEDGPRAFRPFR